MKPLNISLRSTDLIPVKLSSHAVFPADKNLERRMAEARANLQPKYLEPQPDSLVRHSIPDEGMGR